MASPVPHSMPPPQAPPVMGPPQQSGMLAPSQAMVTPHQYASSPAIYPHGLPPSMRNGSAVPGPPAGAVPPNQQFPGGPMNGASQPPPPNVSV